MSAVKHHTFGFGVSALLHVVLLASFLPGWLSLQSSDNGTNEVPVSLSMFQLPPVAPQVETTPEPIDEAPPVVEQVQLSEAAKPEEIIERVAAPQPVEPVTTSEPEPVADEPAVTETATVAQPTAEPLQAVPDSGFIASLEAKYKAALRQAIEAKKFYPKRAKRLKREGQVSVGFIIDRSGQISQIEVARSSGTGSLDHAALTAVRKLARFEPIPDAIPREHWSLEVPMTYTLL